MFSIYCDDFQRKDHGHHTFLHIAFVLSDNLIPCFVEEIKQLKSAYKLKELHCRVLFNGDERKRKNITLDSAQVFALYDELHRFILQFPAEYLNFYVNWCDYLIDELVAIKSLQHLEYYDGTQEELCVNEETIMMFLEHLQAQRFNNKPFLGKFYREKCDTKKPIANCKAMIKDNKKNRMIIQNFGNHEIPFIDAKNAPNPEIYEVADFLAYISGSFLHESQKQIYRKLNENQLFKGRKILQWYNSFQKKECRNIKLFNLNNTKIENGILKIQYNIYDKSQ
jgi:hypothetical protein